MTMGGFNTTMLSTALTMLNKVFGKQTMERYTILKDIIKSI